MSILKPVGPVEDPTNAGFEKVKEPPSWNVPLAYALLDDAPMPAVVTEEDID